MEQIIEQTMEQKIVMTAILKEFVKKDYNVQGYTSTLLRHTGDVQMNVYFISNETPLVYHNSDTDEYSVNEKGKGWEPVISLYMRIFSINMNGSITNISNDIPATEPSIKIKKLDFLKK